MSRMKLVCYTNVLSIGLLIISSIRVSSTEPVDTTYYDLLRISTTATQQEIRQAYKKLAIKLHPDKNPDQNVSDEFVKVSEAYETLKDPDKRLQYDLHGAHPTYARRYDTRSQSEYNNLFFNGLYAGDKFVDNLSAKTYFNYLAEGFHFINFYSPFCPPCQSLADNWKKLAENFKGLVKVAAVNCKYQSDFCYNSMRVSSYPTLLFYQNGKSKHYTVYRGDRGYESLEKFIMPYIENEIQLTYNKIITPGQESVVYIVRDSWLDRHAVSRLALHLKGIVRVVQITDEKLRRKLTSEESNTVVLETGGQYHFISSTQEADILRAVTAALPTLQAIDIQLLGSIRSDLRGNADYSPWVIYFNSGDKTHNLLAQKLKRKFPKVNFGEIDCDNLVNLCLSLQVDSAPAWAIMKGGGAYERYHGQNNFQHLSQFIENAKDTENVQTLSMSEFKRIIDGESGFWIVAVSPYKMSLDDMVEAFTKSSRKYKNIQFGVMMCPRGSEEYCNPIAVNSPVVIVQNKTQRFTFRGHKSTDSLEDFLVYAMDTSGAVLTEGKFHDVLDRRSSEYTWAVAFFPEFCDDNCQQLKYEWKIVTRKLLPITYIKVGSLYCDGSNKRFCDQTNVRSPTLRLYPASSSKSFVAYLHNFNRAAYILEWLLTTLDDTIQQLSRSTFFNNVLAANPATALSDKSNKPWLVYFHSPRCYHCYEMFTDFFITGMMLKTRVNLGRVNCLQEREICNREQIMSYPSIKFYSSGGISRSIHFEPKHFQALVSEVKPHLDDEETLSHFGKVALDSAAPSFKRDEF